MKEDAINRRTHTFRLAPTIAPCIGTLVLARFKD
jgi:hypothetical protein